MYNTILVLLFVYNNVHTVFNDIQLTFTSLEIYCNVEYPTSEPCIPLPQHERELVNLTGHGSLLGQSNL